MTENTENRLPALLAEFVGSAGLAALVIGSGIAAERLSGDAGLQLLENSIATALGLGVLIAVFGHVSGAHFNPVVSVAFAWLKSLSWRRAAAYATVQTAGCIAGALLANAMFGLPLPSFSAHERFTLAIGLSEGVATFGLVLTIFGLLAGKKEGWIPAAVGAYIGAAYWFTSSTSFANPAIAVGRIFSDSFAGIAAASVPGFIAGQFIGLALALAALRLIYPDFYRRLRRTEQ